MNDSDRSSDASLLMGHIGLVEIETWTLRIIYGLNCCCTFYLEYLIIHWYYLFRFLTLQQCLTLAKVLDFDSVMWCCDFHELCRMKL